MPHCETLPLASFLVSFLPYSTSSSQVAGARSGSRPASLNRSLL
ncbi:Uncharacterised protein [Bordetella pertussis]|nr:Uncharacterised protein [Bordetella pertussis]CPK89997.1 Uncharacterised protein [Bordetella pertussis]CPM57858.1 Uncharacterised protein [Bordetella pertussis]